MAPLRVALVAVLAACALAEHEFGVCKKTRYCEKMDVCDTKKPRYCEKMVSKQKCGKRKIATIKCPSYCLETCGAAPGTGLPAPKASGPKATDCVDKLSPPKCDRIFHEGRCDTKKGKKCAETCQFPSCRKEDSPGGGTRNCDCSRFRDGASADVLAHGGTLCIKDTSGPKDSGAGECYQCEYYAGGGASEADGCTYRYSGTLVTYCCEKYACDGCGLIGGGGRRRAEAEAAAAEAAAAGASARAVRGLQLGGDSCANNVQASALSVRVDIAVGNPTMFAFIGRGANVTIHDAEGGLLATGTVPVVPVSLPAQTTTAVAAELSFAPALETLDSGDAVSAALAAVGVTEGGLEQFLTQLLDELTVGLMVDIEVLGWPLQLHRNISTKMSELEAAAGDDDLSADAATALAGLFGGNASECVLCLVGNGGGCLKSTAEFSLALPV